MREEGRPEDRSPAVEGAAAFLQERLDGLAPEALVVLGSGLSDLADEVEGGIAVPFVDVPGYPAPTVEGHAGRYVGGHLEGVPVLVQAGRFHVYEGHSMEQVVAPVRVASALGVNVVIVTNAAGGVTRGLEPGSLMLIEDHVNLMWRSPLAGPVREGEDRFPDMSRPYDPALQRLTARAALELGIRLRRGTYCALAGPTYETPAEVRMLERLGADAVGMSTVPEVVTSRALGLRVLAVSMITNRAAGLGVGSLSHQEVIQVGREAGATLRRLLRRVIAELPGVG